MFLNTSHNETICKFSFNNLKERKNYQGQEDDVFVEIQWSKDFLEFEETIHKDFEKWLKDIGDYIESEQQPDLWELAKKQNNVLGASLQLADYQANTENFTPQEQNLFTLAIKEFERKLIGQYQPTAEVLEKLHTQMADIQADLKKLSKKSWFSKFNEMYLPNILVSLALSSEARATLAWLFEQAFSTVSHILLDTSQLLKDIPALPTNF
ncbi:MAG: hypothetical protein MUE85_05145 [Microscillaceae bacterium]|nr:hypothetical protein [Microscillaceae bacterium]